MPVTNIPLPISLKIELTTRCNLACRFCGRGLAVERLAASRAGAVVPDFRDVMRVNPDVGDDANTRFVQDLVQALPTLTELDLQGVGEPLMYPGLIELIQWLSERSIRVTFTTNGMLLSRRVAQDLLDIGNVERITVSLDSPDDGVFAHIRRGGRLQTVVENLRCLLRLRARMGLSKPTVRLAAALSRHNLAHLEALVRLAGELGVEALAISIIKDVDGELGDWLVDNGTARRALQAAAESAVAAGVTIEDETGLLDSDKPDGAPIPTHSICSWPWLSAMVSVDGYVTPCCYVTEESVLCLGRLGESQSFADIWNGPLYEELRRRLSSGDTMGLPCHGCRDYVRTSRTQLMEHLAVGQAEGEG